MGDTDFHNQLAFRLSQHREGRKTWLTTFGHEGVSFGGPAISVSSDGLIPLLLVGGLGYWLGAKKPWKRL